MYIVHRNPIWTATLPLLVEPPKSLPPSFLGQLLLSGCPRIEGTRHDPFELEVPMKVVYRDPNGDSKTTQTSLD